MNLKPKVKPAKKTYRIGLGLKRLPKKLWLAVGAVMFLPLIALVGRENSPYNSYYLKEISKTDVESNKNYADFLTVNYSFGKLVRGTTDYNNGNYVIYLGTEACSHCTEFLFGNSGYSKGIPKMGSDPLQASWSRGQWGQAIQQADTSSLGLKFLMYEDTPPSSLNKTSDLLWTLPWNTTPITNPNDTGWMSQLQTPGQYIRYDESALKFRAIFDFAKSIKYKSIKNDPDPQETKMVSGTPTIILFKQGVGYLYSKSDNTDTQNFANYLKTFYQPN